MTSPIPQRMPTSIFNSERADFVQTLINAATDIRNGKSTTIPNKAPDPFTGGIVKVLDQINKGEAANPLDYHIPYKGEEFMFFRELLDAIEQLR